MDNKKVEYIFSAIEKAGISVSDFQKLTTISRTTLYNWKNGKAVTDRLRLDLAYHISLKLFKAYQLGKLPLSSEFKKVEKLPEIRRIIHKEITL